MTQEFTPSQIVDQYRNGLITWDEMQYQLRQQGYEMKDTFNTGNYHLLPFKRRNSYS